MDKMPDRPAEFLSYVPWRYREKYKFHNTLAHAKSAVTLKGWGNIYQWNFETNSWVLLWEIPRAEGYGRNTPMPWQT